MVQTIPSVDPGSGMELNPTKTALPGLFWVNPTTSWADSKIEAIPTFHWARLTAPPPSRNDVNEFLKSSEFFSQPGDWVSAWKKSHHFLLFFGIRSWQSRVKLTVQIADEPQRTRPMSSLASHKLKRSMTARTLRSSGLSLIPHHIAVNCGRSVVLSASECEFGGLSRLVPRNARVSATCFFAFPRADGGKGSREFGVPAAACGITEGIQG